MTATGIGASVRRKEDQRFVTGRGHYVDDINRPGQAYAYLPALAARACHHPLDRHRAPRRRSRACSRCSRARISRPTRSAG